jgi:hypothetical protein
MDLLMSLEVALNGEAATALPAFKRSLARM